MAASFMVIPPERIDYDAWFAVKSNDISESCRLFMVAPQQVVVGAASGGGADHDLRFH
jgi:hypothetical protein